MDENTVDKNLSDTKGESARDSNTTQSALSRVNVHGGNAQIIITSGDITVKQKNISESKNTTKEAKRILVLS